jgi:hypothetical protein
MTDYEWDMAMDYSPEEQAFDTYCEWDKYEIEEDM